ncbi:MAG: PKD domain-containing protein [Vicinamibacterales bacterium]
MHSRMRVLRAVVPALVALMGAAACNNEAETYKPSGPSELGLALTLQANPDTLTMDGVSQAQIVIQARGPNGQALRDVSCRIDVTSGGVVADVGKLSSKSAVTGSDGRATVTYTAPQGQPSGNSDPVAGIAVKVTPIGYDYNNAIWREVAIRLVPMGVILPPNGSPEADFSYSPTSPREDDTVSFDASLSKDDGAITSYAWDFGDGKSGTGLRTTHKYDVRGDYTVTLRITDDRGQTAQVSKSLTVGALDNPVASFSASPQIAAVGQSIFFNASASKASPGRRLVGYDWTFGDGGTGEGDTTTHRYGIEGTFTVTLTVSDDTGRTGTATSSVSIGAGQKPTAAFTWSPTSPLVGQSVTFNGSLSTSPGGTSITKYAWDFGDGFTDQGQTVTHRYNTAGDFNVVLTVTDSSGATTSVANKVTVSPTSSQPPTANFVISPSPATRAQAVVFDASASTAQGGFFIAYYDWTFGDSTTVVRCPGDPACGPTGKTITHTYAAAGTFTIGLTVTDGNSRTATQTKTLTVNP